LHIFVKKRVMAASQDYRDNMFGASYVSQFLKKKKKNDEVTCGRDDAKPCGDERGEVRAGGDVEEGKKSPSAGGEKNEVLDPKEAKKWGKKIGQVKKNAPAMKNLTKNQQKALEMGPPKPTYTKG
jgi:hypothetical protein